MLRASTLNCELAAVFRTNSLLQLAQLSLREHQYSCVGAFEAVWPQGNRNRAGGQKLLENATISKKHGSSTSHARTTARLTRFSCTLLVAPA